jgi:WD40 repeat protein
MGICCCAVIGGGLLYLRSNGQTLQGLLSDSPQSPWSTEAALPDGPAVTVEAQPVEIPTPTPQTASPPSSVNNQLLVAVSNGVWLVNREDGSLLQVSYDTLENYGAAQIGMSPDKQYFAYISGFGGASINPALMIVNLQDQSIKLRQELTGPLSQPGIIPEICEPAFEATRAMQFDGSLAWSPDGQTLAFVGALDGETADVYLFNRADDSITRLSDEPGHATGLHWSPDGSWIEYLSVDCFGTGAGFAMNGLWAAEPQSGQTRLLEPLQSSGEEFVGWSDNSTIIILSWGAGCEAYNLRAVNVLAASQQVLVTSCFSAIAFNPASGEGLLSVSEFNAEFCSCGEPLKPGLYRFGANLPLSKLNDLEAYQIEFIGGANLYYVLVGGSPQNLFQEDGLAINSPLEVQGLKPYPSPTGEYWAWASSGGGKTGLWVTKENTSPISLSPLFSGDPVWSTDGQTLYFIENNKINKASAPQFRVELLAEISGDIWSLIQ